jgi:octaprenyl-diphosphate synthase
MRELKHSLGLEQPKINAALAGYVAALPGGARPVAEHVLAAGGKRLRPFLTLATGRALGARNAEPDALDADLYALGAAVEMLHAATLLHDDILDNAALRRGKPAAHTVFDPSRVILAGDALLAKALLVVSRLGDARLTACIAEAVMRTAEGEILEAEQMRDPSLSHEGYLDMITGKTAWMLRAACELGAIRAGAGEDLTRAAAGFGLELGIAFQMVDDALDYSPAEQTGKPCGGDLREGKITPPLSSYLASLAPEEAGRLRRAIAENSLQSPEIDNVCAAVHQAGHAGKTRALAAEHLRAAGAFLAAFPPSGERVVLEQMLWHIQGRDH